MRFWRTRWLICWRVDGAIVHRVSYHGDVGTHVAKVGGRLTAMNKLNEIPADKRNEFMSRIR